MLDVFVNGMYKSATLQWPGLTRQEFDAAGKAVLKQNPPNADGWSILEMKEALTAELTARYGAPQRA